MSVSTQRSRSGIFTTLAIGCLFQLHAQYYLAGTVADSSKKPLPFVKLRLHSNGMLFEAGGSGGFGIPSKLKTDTVTCVLAGYDTLQTILFSSKQNLLVLTPNAESKRELKESSRLSSFTKNLEKDAEYRKFINGESYTELVENSFVNTTTYPSTGFSPNANNAAYSNTRRFINNKSEVPPDAVRMEELLNYFSLSCAAPPNGDNLFNIDTRITDCPWNPKNLLLFVNARAKTLNLDKVPPANLVFLIDNSGSMDMPNRLPLLKSGFQMLVKNLRDTDRVAIVTYGGTAAIALEPTRGSEKEKIIKAIQEIVPGGATPGSNGIQLAYQLATTNKFAKGNNRVILATDGDFNVGITEEKELEKLIESYSNTGVYLTCLGVGMGNYKDSKIEVLAKHGNGNFAYLDKEQEAEKVLVKELTQNLYALASDVTIQLDFNAALIKHYRLIGYDNRKEAIKDSASQLLGAEIGSGFSMVSVIEIEPADTSSNWKNKMQDAVAGSVKIHYTDALKGKRSGATSVIPFNYLPFDATDKRIRFATALTMFGNLLRRSPVASNISFGQVLPIAINAIDKSDPLQLEFIELLQGANIIYNPVKKKKWGRKREE